jgi:hypothetical protein
MWGHALLRSFARQMIRWRWIDVRQTFQFVVAFELLLKLKRQTKVRRTKRRRRFALPAHSIVHLSKRPLAPQLFNRPIENIDIYVVSGTGNRVQAGGAKEVTNTKRLPGAIRLCRVSRIAGTRCATLDVLYSPSPSRELSNNDKCLMSSKSSPSAVSASLG